MTGPEADGQAGGPAAGEPAAGRGADGQAGGPAAGEPAAGPGAAGPAGGPGVPSRRQLLAGAGVFGAGAVAGGLAGHLTWPGGDQPGAEQTVPFYGPHQAGIATPAQDRLAFGSLNVVAGATRADLRDLLREWTTAAARMAGGKLIGEVTAPYAPPVDTGEAAGSPVSRLTITHIRLASFEHNGGTRILRRGYSFTDGIDPRAGTLLGGLFFIAFMKDPGQFIRLQRALAADALNEYVHHTGSAVFACPPGLRPGQHWGDSLFT